jgi:hypothetical protein
MKVNLMDERTWVLEQIELAQRDVPVCEACGAPTVPVPYDGGSIWLECRTLQQPKSALQRLLGLEFLAGHTRRRVADAAHLRAAA